MTVIAGTLVIGTETFTNQSNNLGIGIYRVSKVDFFPVHGSPPSPSTIVEFSIDIIDGDTFEILNGNTFSRTIADGETLVTINETQINFTRPDATLPNTIIANWKVSTFDNVSNTIIFTGEDPPEPIPDLSMATIAFNNNQVFKDNHYMGSVTVFKNPSFPPEFEDRTLTLFLQIKSPTGSVIGLQNRPFKFEGGSVLQFDFERDINFAPTITLEAFLWDKDQQVYAPDITLVLNEVTTTLQNLVTVRAEDGFTITGIIDDPDVLILEVGLPTFNATIQSNSKTDLPVNTTAIDLLNFAEQHQTIPPPPPPQNWEVIVRAENNNELGGVLTTLDKDVVIAGVGAFNAVVASSNGTTSPVSSSATILLGFAEANQVNPPPPDENINFEVNFLTGASPKFYTLTSSDLDLLKATLAPCATISKEFLTPEPPQNLTTVQTEINLICSEPPPPPPPTNDKWFEVVTAQNGNIKSGILDDIDHQILVVGLPILGASTDSVTTNLPVDSTSVILLKFATDNQIIPPKINGKVVQIIKGAFFGTLAIALLGSRGR